MSSATVAKELNTSSVEITKADFCILAISFAIDDSNNTTITYYSLKYHYDDSQLGTQDVPRDGLANGDSLKKYGPDNKGQAYVLDVN